MHTHTGLFAVNSSDFSAQKQQEEKSFMENTSPAGKQSPRVLLPLSPEEAFGDWDFGLLPALGSRAFPTACTITHLGRVESFLPLLGPYTEGLHSIYSVQEHKAPHHICKQGDFHPSWPS